MKPALAVLACAVLAFAAGAASAQPLPVLHFAPPQGFTGSLGRDPSAHISMSGDAIVKVHPFRPLAGAFAEQFRRTLLREALKPQDQEVRLGGPAEIAPVAVPGAQEALFARFIEDRHGAARYRMRLAVYSTGAVALVEYDANGPDAYQRNWPAFAGVLDSLKVSNAVAAAPSSPEKRSSEKTTAADGLYLASTRRFVMSIGGAPGSGSWQMATRFYLLSPDGRFHRGYDLPSVPGGDLRRFDYDAAARADRGNTGTYTRKGNRLVFASGTGERLEATLSGEELAVDSLKFRKAALKK